ncbi:hypothetical protein [Dietzia alimentaria]|uniref:PH-like domain-containing protein n=1 Tax=Dietzia alimentaria TaxID=665550 RepID=UPI00029AF8F9|nr:hypothetical protein [Dietzia alimentaria]
MSQNFWTVVVVVALFVGLLGLMALGWRNRTRRQSGLFYELPKLPADPGEIVLGPLSGVYIGSTEAGDWHARIARAPLGHRSAGTITAHTGGIRFELAGHTVWIPRTDLVDVRRESALANKTVPGGGILVARWQVEGDDGRTFIDSGFRADDKDTYPRWEALRGDATTDQPDTPRSTTEEKQ